MRAWNGDAKLKERTVAVARAHAEEGLLVKGTYWDKASGAGCAVGCLTHDPAGGHHLYPKLWGIPEALAHAEDAVFEYLPWPSARSWPERFLDAVPVGADLGAAWPRAAAALLSDERWGVAWLHDPPVQDDILRIAGLVAKADAGQLRALLHAWVQHSAPPNGHDVPAVRCASWSIVHLHDVRFAIRESRKAVVARVDHDEDAGERHALWFSHTLLNAVRGSA